MAGDEIGSNGVSKLNWRARSLMKTLHQLGGRATTTELRDESLVESSKTVKRRMRNVLDPDGLVITEQPQPEPDSEVMPAKEFELTSAGETVAKQLLDTEETIPEGEFETLEDRLDWIEARQNSAYGAWEKEKSGEYENQLELTRVVRDFLLEEHGDEFKKYVDENYDP